MASTHRSVPRRGPSASNRGGIPRIVGDGQLDENRSRFTARWRRAVESRGGPTVESLGRSPERTAQGFAAEIQVRLDWRTSEWEPLIRELRAAGFNWESWLAAHPPVPGEHGELARVQRAGSQGLAELVEAQAARLRQAELSVALQAQRTYLAGFSPSDAAAVLLQAQDTWDAEAYEEACRELARLEGIRKIYEDRVALLGKMEATAPAWAHAISRRQPPHDAAQPPGEASAAWRWRQWHQELDRRAAVSMSALQERVERAGGRTAETRRADHRERNLGRAMRTHGASGTASADGLCADRAQDRQRNRKACACSDAAGPAAPRCRAPISASVDHCRSAVSTRASIHARRSSTS